MDKPNALTLRNDLIIARAKHQQGAITTDELYQSADAYIAALREYKKRTGKKLTIPSRAYLIRAL